MITHILDSLSQKTKKAALALKTKSYPKFETRFGFLVKFYLELGLPGKDFTPWVYALYRVNKRVLTRKIGQFRVTLRDITP